MAGWQRHQGDISGFRRGGSPATLIPVLAAYGMQSSAALIWQLPRNYVAGVRARRPERNSVPDILVPWPGRDAARRAMQNRRTAMRHRRARPGLRLGVFAAAAWPREPRQRTGPGEQPGGHWEADCAPCAGQVRGPGCGAGRSCHWAGVSGQVRRPAGGRRGPQRERLAGWPGSAAGTGHSAQAEEHAVFLTRHSAPAICARPCTTALLCNSVTQPILLADVSAGFCTRPFSLGSVSRCSSTGHEP